MQMLHFSILYAGGSGRRVAGIFDEPVQRPGGLVVGLGNGVPEDVPDIRAAGVVFLLLGV